MIKTTFYIGLNDQETKKQEIATEKALDIIEETFDKYSEYGATLYHCRGIYKHVNGEKVREETIAAFVLDIEEDAKISIIETLKKELNQESILITEEDIKATFT